MKGRIEYGHCPDAGEMGEQIEPSDSEWLHNITLEEIMRTESRYSVLHEHMTWARGIAIFWLLLCLTILGGAVALTELFNLPSELRPVVIIAVGTILIVNAIWQAAGLALVRIETVILPRFLGH